MKKLILMVLLRIVLVGLAIFVASTLIATKMIDNISYVQRLHLHQTYLLGCVEAGKTRVDCIPGADKALADYDDIAKQIERLSGVK